jgi:hypothetical protein
MTTITLPPDIEGPLAEAARQRGMTTERFALDALRRFCAPLPSIEGAPNGGTLFDFLVGYIGTVDGTAEALSENTGRRFAEGLARKHQQRRS